MSTIPALIQKQKSFFGSGQTKSLDFRLEQLKKLEKALIKHEKPLQEALFADLGKSNFEAYTAEIGITIADIRFMIKHLPSWVKPRSVKTPLFFLPAKSYVLAEPYGTSLIIAPWNYPVKNLIGPALGSIAAGNTLLLKPSEISAHTSKAIYTMISEFFPEEYMAVIEGGSNETSQLLEEKVDYIFFTGGPGIGKIIYQAAAKNLTPCTLELGGKSPSIIDENVNLDVAVKRLIWGKFYNAGQTCVAPDYTFVHKNIKEAFILKVKQYLIEFFGENPKLSSDYGRIISNKHVDRLQKLIQGNILVGGDVDASIKYISPTVINDVKHTDAVMQEEIFGPIMPILDFSSKEEVVRYINEGEKPLALYIFTQNNAFADYIIDNTSSGGVCVNETTMHMVTPHLPFGGVGNSGLGGAYNGKFGFDTFSHYKPIMKKSFWFDLDKKYPPYTKDKQNFIKFALKKLI